MGIRDEKTMQLHVQIGAHQFTALLDSGSTHNFISTEAARCAELQFQDSHGAHVVVANGDQVACRGLARNTKLEIGGEVFSVDCFVIRTTHVQAPHTRGDGGSAEDGPMLQLR